MTTASTQENGTTDAASKAEFFKTLVRAIITLLLMAAAAWWLVEVATRLGMTPTKDQDGNIVLDEYQRAKDILLVVLPLVTTALGYWFGSQGKERAEDEANKAKDKLTAVAATSSDPELLANARRLYPTSFRD
jgi:hypothetical protein